MLNRGLLLGLVLLSAGLLAGCSDDGNPSPFEGDWYSADAGRLSFEGDRWSDGEGDSGRFDFSGKYPTFNLIFRSDAGQFEKVATFADTRTMELCSVPAVGVPVECHDFAFDKPTLH